MVNGYRLECPDGVIATHLPTVAQPALVRAAWSESALALFTSYVIAAEVPRGAAPDVLFWDTGDPYRYLRVVPGRSSDVLIFGGHDHRSDEHVDPDERYAELERDLNGVLPDARVLNRWRGEVIISADGLPIIGYPAPHQFVATGFNGNGITLGTLAAMMAADALTGRRNPWCELFAADRPALREPVGHCRCGVVRRGLSSSSRASRLLSVDFAQPVPDTTVKAAFVARFSEFVEWPPSDRTASRVLSVCLSPAHPFGTKVAESAGTSVQGRPVSVRTLGRRDVVDGCDVLLPSPALT